MSTTDPRKLLAASRKSRRITSPYASYSLAGALFCNICSNTPIKSESLWEAHVASAQHKSNVARRGGTVSSGTSKNNKRPAEASSSSDPRHGRSDGPAASKRLKIAKADVKNLALPVGFFDQDDDEDEEGIVSTGEAIEPDDEDENPTPPEPNQPPQPTSSSTSSLKLPADFFSAASTKPKNDDLDDEWAAFQADIAQAEETEAAKPTAHINHTISAPALTAAQIQQQSEEGDSSLNTRNARTIAEEEMEDARAALADFFDEQNTLEERVARLKERREMLRRAANAPSSSMRPPPQPSPKPGIHRSNSVNSVKSVTMGGMDESNPVPELQSEASDDDYEDDDEMFLRRR